MRRRSRDIVGLVVAGDRASRAAPNGTAPATRSPRCAFPGMTRRAFERIEAGPATISGDGIAGSLADFVRALRTGAIPMNECHDNIKSFAMVTAAVESSRSGRRVAVEVL